MQGGECGGCQREREREKDISDDWHDGGEGEYREFIIFQFGLWMADKADQRRISSVCSPLKSHHQTSPVQIHLYGSS